MERYPENETSITTLSSLLSQAANSSLVDAGVNAEAGDDLSPTEPSPSKEPIQAGQVLIPILIVVVTLALVGGVIWFVIKTSKWKQYQRKYQQEHMIECVEDSAQTPGARVDIIERTGNDIHECVDDSAQTDYSQITATNRESKELHPLTEHE